MTPYAERIGDRWSAFMRPPTADVETFADMLLRSARENGFVAMRMVSETEISIHVGNDAARASDAYARGIFRSLLAWLAQLFADGVSERFKPYGAQIECTFGVPRARFRLQLNFMNQGSDVWFELRSIPLVALPA